MVDTEFCRQENPKTTLIRLTSKHLRRHWTGHGERSIKGYGQGARPTSEGVWRHRPRVSLTDDTDSASRSTTPSFLYRTGLPTLLRQIQHARLLSINEEREAQRRLVTCANCTAGS